MQGEKFTTTSMTISAILGLINANDIAIPEIQRPFVWKPKQVRDLLDSLYKGYPVGYVVLWKNPNVKLKDGTISSGKKSIDRWSTTYYCIDDSYSGKRNH